MLRAGMRTLFTISGVLLASAGLPACADESSSEEDAPGARVTRVIDGDTVVMERLGQVRLIGVNAPEWKRCYERAATRFTRDRLEDQVVQYEIGAEPKDRYDRTLAYLSREGNMHNLDLLSEGYAKVLTIPPNDKYEARFERAEREAKNTDVGLWDKCDRDAIRARRAAARRREEAAEERRLAAAARREARRARRAARAEARRARAAARRAQREAEEQSSDGQDDSASGSSGGASGRFACGPGDIDGDGDGRCHE
jgi:endonuclease YncB( thermonuclease family)